ncbi:hypothetical protein KC19_8G185700 [Ceratodon purpureus]|uniref:Myb-like domain-containing protein n=1 Tax=Ceratodon purpureus TaxID=3225 RepID=A0A8T0H217_CERPU|nr:hypothetical protein KC19_8G185700 [Ceratodon purpureus]
MDRAMPTIGVPRPAPGPSGTATSSQSKRARKDRGPNWLPSEIFALIGAKREMFLEELDTVDGRDLMTPDTSKWLRVSQCVMQAGFSPCLRDGPACKTKWNQMIPDNKKIADYLSRTGRNSLDYWEMNSAERKAEMLPRLFGQDVFDAIHEWFGNRPQIQPPHIRDLLSPTDSNYRQPQQQRQQDEEPDSMPSLARTASAGLPPGIHPHVISSSDTSQYAVHKRPGNTTVRRKSLSGHTMQEIADASRELERSKIEVQLKLFTEQMAYQREKDRRMYETATIANENARLAILKQGEMVSCLS